MKQGGTGGNARIPGLDISGKTGTVQVIAQHGWVQRRSRCRSSIAITPGSRRSRRSRIRRWSSSSSSSTAAHGGAESAPLAKLLYEARFRENVTGARIDLSNPETLQQIKEGELPLPTTR